MTRAAKKGRALPLVARDSCPASVAVVAAERHRKTRQDRSSELAEDYVEVIAELQQECGEARLVGIAQRLGVTHVTATRTLSRLERLGLVRRQRYRAIFLTTEGQELAQLARYRHTIVLEFLRVLGVNEAVAQNDAEGIEHHVSAETLRVFAEFIKRSTKRVARGGRR